MQIKKTIVPKLRILLVEDEQPDRMLISKAVQGSGFDTDLKYAENIEDALIMTTIHSFDCILLDYYFTNSANGFDFIKSYQLKNGDAPIIMVTSFNEPSLVVESMKMGVADYIAKKDLSPENIAKSFNYILRIREAEINRGLAEKALMESELRMKTIVERSPVIVFTIDSNGFFKLFKGQGTSILMIKPEHVIGQNIRDIWQHTPIRITDYHQALKLSSFSSQVEVNNHHFEVNYIPVVNPQHKTTGMMGVAIDVTGFKRNEEELLNTIELTETSARIKEQFLANISHELRTPIHGILSLVNFITNTDLNADQSKQVELISRSADNLLAIVNDILDLSKIESGKMSFEEITFNLKETINSCIGTLAAKANEKKLPVNVTFNNNVLELFLGDPVRLTQILNNLVGNAIKFTEKGSVEVHINSTDHNEDCTILQFQVRDTGIGIPANKLAGIYESFTQAGTDITRKYGGTGLGLTIAKKLIEQQNGTIHVESSLGQGTTFTFNLPYKHAKTITNTLKNTMSNADFSNLNILVAEDNDINCFIIQKMIKDWKATLTFANSGEECVRQVSANTYNIVLMDIEMPGMNGYQAAEMIRNELKNTTVPIIAMTGHAMAGEKEKCIRSGMNDYILKPFQADDLKNAIQKWTKESETSASQVIESNDSESTSVQYTNLVFLREISDGNEVFFREFITLFLNSAPVSIEEMEKSYEKKDWETLRQVAHKIKPSFNYVGLKELNLAAGRIEESAKKQTNTEEIPALIQKIKSVCEIAFRELEEGVKAGLA